MMAHNKPQYSVVVTRGSFYVYLSNSFSLTMVFTARSNQLSEYLSYDILDEKFIRLFQPYRVVQKILGSCRVDIKYRFVTPPTLLQKLYTITCITMTIISTNNVQQIYSTIFYSEHEMTSLWTSGICGLLGVFSLSILHARFFNNERNVQLYIKMQEIDRIMKLGKNEQIYHQHYKYNRAVVFAQVAVTFVSVVLGAFLVKDKFGIMELIATFWAMETLIFEISCCASYMIYFTTRLQLINYTITVHFKYINYTTQVFCEKYESNMVDRCLDELFDGIHAFKNQYQFQVSSTTIIHFQSMRNENSFVWGMWDLYYITHINFHLRRVCCVCFQRILSLDLLHIAVIALVKAIVLVGLCIQSELFVREGDKTKKLTISVLSRHIDGPFRTKAKKMLKLIEESPPCFSVYEMWRVDAKLLLNLFNIISTILVILLQFAFL
ncbi:uncharacterized protein LOC133517435 [Cydia pomonella]|uniref:uncharacterized protein LOC133517435 n=1 Tax=Cydia pomonella TaxID=82600 RepID=UPI002ADDC8BE|nr:uncharacterized protein LOC133517435 [Cydia pomonella]